MSRHITVIGGGITGLTAAYTLKKLREASEGRLDFTLLERDAKLGGKLVTEERDGFIIEGGPDSFITQKPHGLQLCRELGLQDRLLPCNTAGQKVFILHKGNLEPLPEGVRLTVPTKAMSFLKSGLVSPLGKLRMLAEPFIPARTEEGDESLADFVERRLGREAVEKLAGPLMAGIYVSDPQRMSIQGTFPLFAMMERKHGSLIKAMRKAAKDRRKSGKTPPAMFMSLKGGMGELAQTLVKQVEAYGRTGTDVRSIERLENDRYRLMLPDGPLDTDAIICTAPAYAASGLLRPLAPAIADELDTLRYVSTATVTLGFQSSPDNLPHRMQGFGFVVPKPEPCRLLACTWSSTKFDGRAQEGHFLVRAFIGGEGYEDLVDLSDRDLIDLVRRELNNTMHLVRAPDVTAVYRWPKANPQYDVGHLDKIDRIEQHLARDCPNLLLAGGAYRGIGIPDCIHAAQSAVAQLVE